jgi:hypothetical protein
MIIEMSEAQDHLCIPNEWFTDNKPFSMNDPDSVAFAPFQPALTLKRTSLQKLYLPQSSSFTVVCLFASPGWLIAFPVQRSFDMGDAAFKTSLELTQSRGEGASKPFGVKDIIQAQVRKYWDR